MTLSSKAETGSPTETWKRLAAERALGLVRDGMVVGLGTGSTARYFIDGVAQLHAAGTHVLTVPTSGETAERARALGLPVVERIDRPLDLAVDGADEIDPSCNCVKGRGGALLREKVVAQAAARFVLIADAGKLVDRLGGCPVPVEILPFLWSETSRRVAGLGGRPSLRGGADAPFLTDNGNYVLDVTFASIADPEDLGRRLKAIAGVLEHGLFIGLARSAIVAGPGGIRILGEPISEA